VLAGRLAQTGWTADVIAGSLVSSARSAGETARWCGSTTFCRTMTYECFPPRSAAASADGAPRSISCGTQALARAKIASRPRGSPGARDVGPVEFRVAPTESLRPIRADASAAQARKKTRAPSSDATHARAAVAVSSCPAARAGAGEKSFLDRRKIFFEMAIFLPKMSLAARWSRRFLEESGVDRGASRKPVNGRPW
jgi:hypothetical protein